MPSAPTKCAPATRVCHWEEIQGARVKGGIADERRLAGLEFPYRTMRRDGPGAECTDCPVFHEMQEQKARQAR